MVTGLSVYIREINPNSLGRRAMNVGYNRVKLVVDDLFNFSRNIPRIVRRLAATAGEGNDQPA